MNIKEGIGLFVLVLLVGVGSAAAQEAQWDAAIGASNPLNWYKFDETDNICVDRGSGGNNGTYSLVTLGRPGLLRGARAVEFTGPNTENTAASQVDFSGLGVLTGEWTAEYIVMKKGTDNQALHDGGSFSIRIQGWNSQQAGFTEYGVADHFFTEEPGKSAAVPVDTWVHLVYRRTASGMQLFINGILVGTTSTTIDFPRAFIGRNGSNATGDTFKGILDEAVVFNRALSDAEIMEHFLASQLTAVLPFPEDGMQLVDKATNLEWTYGAYVPTGYDVYFGTDANELSPAWFGHNKILDKQNVNTVDPSPTGVLAPATTYYWRVDAYEPNEPGADILHIGHVWSFTTSPDTPVLVESPKDVVVPAGGQASLTVAGLNQTDYAWWRSVDDATDTPDDDTLVAEGGDLATLVLENVQLEDEGYYYCVISNQLDSLRSAAALVMIERMVAQWKFEGNLMDELGEHNGVGLVMPGGDQPGVVQEPNYVPGIIGEGSAVVVNGVNQLIEIPFSRKLNPASFTVTAWARPDALDSDYRAVVSGRQEVPGVGGSQGGLIIYATGGDNWEFWTGHSGGWQNSGTVLLPVTVEDEAWTHLAISFEATGQSGENLTGIKRLYINGRLVALNTEGLYRPNPVQALQIGAGQNETINHDYFFGGAIDDVALYNYALDGMEVGRLYHEVTGERVCADNIGLEFDWNGNCKVDIGDLAIFAASWLNCRIVPDCLP